MNLFLTSNIGGIKKENGEKIAVKFFENNNFLNNLKNSLPNNKKFILVASNPNNMEQNDYFLELDIKALKLSGLVFEEYLILDDRNRNEVQKVLENSSLIFLCGGNTFQQNKFFNEIELKNHLKNTDACIVGISAGSMNSADFVFNTPEKEEELTNPRILPGLSLTKYNVEPHFDINNDNKLQMDAVLEESKNRIIYGLPDGSYIKDNIIYGKCYKIQNGLIKVICEDEEKILID